MPFHGSELPPCDRGDRREVHGSGGHRAAIIGQLPAPKPRVSLHALRHALHCLAPWTCLRRGLASAASVVALVACVPAGAQIAPVSPAAGMPAPDAATAPAPRRPKIGLVLSGGGARGMTHVGVLKVMKQLNVEVDFIAATSMGAIVGGLYASGMSPDEMEKQIEGINWTTMLSDSPARNDVSFRRKEFEAQFPLGLEIGFRDGEFRTLKGALSGSNLELFLHELTRNVDRIDNFDKLPIPFRAIATDMVNGEQITFSSGRLYQAMRASMSVPGMFSPVELEGRILGDGGLVNNLPVDVVRAMGAEVVIAVNIGTPLASRSQLSSIVGYASQMLNILTEQNVRAQLGTLGPKDVLISPDLGDLTFIDFGKAPEFIDLGVKAAEAVRDKLARLSSTPVQYAVFEQRMLVPAQTLPKTLDFVRIEGTHYANPQALEDQMQTKAGEPFSLKELEKDMSLLYGRGDFEQIDYALVNKGGQDGVVVSVTEKSWGPNFLRFGLFLSTDLQGDSTFNALAGHRRVWINSLGAQWTNEVVLGSTRRYATEFYQPLSLGTRLYMSAYGLAQRAPDYIFDGNARVAEYDVLTQYAGVDVGTTFGTSGDIRFGYRWAHNRADPEIAAKADPGNPELTPNFTIKTTETGLRFLVRWDSLDNPFFPRRGLRTVADVFVGPQQLEFKVQDQNIKLDFDNAARAGVDANYAFEIDRKNFFNVGFRAAGVRDEQNNVITDYSLGGFLQLSGLRTNQLSGSYLGLGRVVYYHELMQVPVIGGAVFAGGSIEAGNVWDTRDDISSRNLVTAGSLFLAANTWLGPAYIAYGRASGGQSTYYLFLGRP